MVPPKIKDFYVVAMCSFLSFSRRSSLVVALVLVSLCAQTIAQQHQRTESANQDEQQCPESLSSVIDSAMEAAKMLIHETYEAIDPNSGNWDDNNRNKVLYDTYMGAACDANQIRAVLEKMDSYSNGVLCSDRPGYAYNSHGSILLANGFQKYKHNPSDNQGCNITPGRSAAYTFVHEMSHAFDFVQSNGDLHRVDDGETAPIRTSQGGSKCYEIECVMSNAKSDMECFNGFMAQAYQFLTWGIHCQNETPLAVDSGRSGRKLGNTNQVNQRGFYG